MATIERGLLIRDDVAHFDGVTRTASRVDATGGTVTGLNFGDAVDVLQVFGGGTSRSASTISDAVGRLAGAAGTFLFSTGTWTIEASVTIPSTITCIIPQGTTFSIDSGRILTLNSQIEAGFYQIFSGAGTVAGLGKNIIFPDWWGALFDGSNNDAAAFNSALTIGGHVFGRPGSTVWGVQVITKSNTFLELDPECIVRRSWAGTNGSRPDNATIKNENAPLAAAITVDPGPLVPSTFDTDIHISGGQWGHLADDAVTYRGTHVALIAVRGGSFSGQFKTQRSEWNTVFWVEDFSIPYVDFQVADGVAASNDGLHIIGGKNISVGTVIGNCDDDLVAVGNNQNIGIDGVSINQIIGSNTGGNAIKVFQIRNGATAAFATPTEAVKNITVGKITGTFAGERSGVYQTLLDLTTDKTLVNNVVVNSINAQITGTADVTNAHALWFTGGKNIHFGTVNITGTPVRDIIEADDVVNLTIDRFDSVAPTKSGERVADMTTITGFKVGGGKVICNAQAGFKLDSVTGAEILSEISEVSDTFAGIILQGTSDCVVKPGTKIIRTSGQTTSIGVRSDSGATNTSLIVDGVDLVDIDIPIQLNTIPTDFKQSNNLGVNPYEIVTATNVITHVEDGKTFYLNSAGGFTSTLPVPAIGLKYKFIVSTAPTTAYIITTNAGANLLFGTFLDIVGELVYLSAQDTLNFVANTSLVGDFLEVESDGTNWYCVAKSGADGGITVSVT